MTESTRMIKDNHNRIELGIRENQWFAKIWDNGNLRIRGFNPTGFYAMMGKSRIKKEMQLCNPGHVVVVF